MHSFELWWNFAPHRAKYSKDHPAYLAGKESWDAVFEMMSAKVAARDAAIADLQAALNSALANQDEVIKRNNAQIELLKSALSKIPLHDPLFGGAVIACKENSGEDGGGKSAESGSTWIVKLM